MARILAIEPDLARSVTLQRLVRQHLKAEVVLTASTDDALVMLADVPPDVILTSSLLSAGDDEQLSAHLRAARDLDHLPILTIPPLVEREESDIKPAGLWSRLLFLRRRPQQKSPDYDFSAIATSIEEALKQSKSEAPESEIDRPARQFLLEAGRGGSTSLVRLRGEDSSRSDFTQWRSRARRWNSHEIPWLSSVQLVLGEKLRLLNISSTGLLVESDVQLTLGNKTPFQLEGPDQEALIVPASVVRAEPSGEDQSEMKYVVAAVFDRPFDSLGPVRSLRQLRRFLEHAKKASGLC